jgi:hypothetical protein
VGPRAPRRAVGNRQGLPGQQPATPSSFSQIVISEYLDSADWRGQIGIFRDVYRERRDAMLAVSGNLDRTIGGTSVQLASPENRRRTFYAAISRHDLDSLLRLFDFPDPNVTSDQRTVTTVPLQQLFVLNSEFLIRQAKALACRLNAVSDGADASRIRHAFMLVYGRPPTDDELQLGLEFVANAKTDSAPGSGGGGPDNVQPNATAGALSKWEQYSQVLLSANEFMYVD